MTRKVDGTTLNNPASRSISYAQPVVATTRRTQAKAVQHPQATITSVVASPKHQSPATVQGVSATIKQQPAASADSSPQKVVQQHQQQVKREASAPRTPCDPAEVKILSTNLVSLNNQIDYVNKIKDLAQAKKLPSEYLYKTVESLADPSPNFTVSYFKKLKTYTSKIVSDTDAELSQFDQPSISPLRLTLRSVQTEIEGIWQRVKTDLALHRAEKAKQQVHQNENQRHEEKQTASKPSNEATSTKEQPSGSQQVWQQLPRKRPRSEAAVPAPKDSQPAEKRKRKTLLQSPDSEHRNTEANELSSPRYSASRFGCAFCQSTAHKPVKCPVYATPEEREERRAQLNLCYGCLRPFGRGHFRECTNKLQPCTHCHGHKSNVALCKWLHLPPRKEKPQRAKSFFTREDETFHREEYFEDDGAEFSPPISPVHHEVVETTEDER